MPDKYFGLETAVKRGRISYLLQTNKMVGESMNKSPLRIGLIGASKIGRSFVAGIRASSTVVAKGVASRNLEAAKAFADETGIEAAYGSYDDMLRDPDTDAVYISLPNGLHAEWSIRSVEAGKHVLCEKPLSVSTQEAVAMFSAARTAGVHLVEAYPYLAQPQTIGMRKMLRDGAIGRVRMINAQFGYSIRDPATDIRMSSALGGGALLDTGSYAISFARVVAGARPLRVCANATWFAEGVDRTLTAMIEFQDGLLAQVGCSFETASSVRRSSLVTPVRS
jgi:xylose dehydrogenase (NAD/NADP)